jgi:hypothetical protein
LGARPEIPKLVVLDSLLHYLPSLIFGTADSILEILYWRFCTGDSIEEILSWRFYPGDSILEILY